MALPRVMPGARLAIEDAAKVVKGMGQNILELNNFIQRPVIDVIAVPLLIESMKSSNIVVRSEANLKDNRSISIWASVCSPMSVISKESAQRVNWSRQSSITPTVIGLAQTIGIASIETRQVRGRRGSPPSPSFWPSC